MSNKIKTPAEKNFNIAMSVAIAVNAVLAVLCMSDAFQNASGYWRILFIGLCWGSTGAAFYYWKKVEPKIYSMVIVIALLLELLVTWIIISSIFKGE